MINLVYKVIVVKSACCSSILKYRNRYKLFIYFLYMVAKYMGTGYRPGKTPSGEYPQFACDEGSGAIVRALSMHGSNDCVDFHKKNRDKSPFGSFWDN